MMKMKSQKTGDMVTVDRYFMTYDGFEYYILAHQPNIEMVSAIEYGDHGNPVASKININDKLANIWGDVTHLNAENTANGVGEVLLSHDEKILPPHGWEWVI